MSQCTATVDVGGETVRCWRQAGHEYSHISPDDTRWTNDPLPPPPAHTYARADRMAEQIAALAARLDTLELRVGTLEGESVFVNARLVALEAAQRPASGRESDDTGASGQRQPANPADDYPPYPLTAMAAELAALKARRCDGCAHWNTYRQTGQTYGDCEEPNVHAVSGWTPIGTPANHACNAWQPRPYPQAPKVDA